jgi:hypothetical protein
MPILGISHCDKITLAGHTCRNTGTVYEWESLTAPTRETDRLFYLVCTMHFNLDRINGVVGELGNLV